MALDILGILGVVDVKGHKIEIREYNVRSCGGIIISGSLVEEQDLKLASASNPPTQQPQLTYRGDPTPPKLSKEVIEETSAVSPQLSSQVIEGTSPQLSSQVIEGTSPQLSSQVRQGQGPSVSILKEKRKTRSGRNDAELDSQPEVIIKRVDKTVAMSGKRSRSRVVDTPLKTVGKDSPVATRKNDDDERGMRLRTRQITPKNRNKKVNVVKVPTKKLPVPRSAAYMQSLHILRNRVNYYKRKHTDPVHRRNKCGQKNYHSCSDCGKTFTAHSALTKHLTSHSTERPFPCTICGQRFKRATHRKFHEDSHKGLRPFVCKQSDCGKAFRVKWSLIRHELVHSSSKTKEHACDSCGKTFRRKDILRAHVERVHPKDQTGYKLQCSDCDKTFRYPSELAIHSVRHSTERPFPCTTCGASFKRVAQLKCHEVTHKRTRPFLCQRLECGASFKTKRNLVRHELVHIRTKDHVCDICGKAYKMKSGLEKHINEKGHGLMDKAQLQD